MKPGEDYSQWPPENVMARLGRYYDRAGNPLTLWEWAEKIDLKERIVEQTEISTDVRVSTVWIGIDHNFLNPGNPPLIFETMVFGGPNDLECHRYSTEEEARLGHSGVVEMQFTALAVRNRILHPGAP